MNNNIITKTQIDYSALKALMAEKDLNQTQLSELVGMSSSAINKYFNHYSYMPVDVMISIQQKLQIPDSEFKRYFATPKGGK